MSTLSTQERKLAARLLHMAAGRFANHGCNDFPLPNTDENRDLMRRMDMEMYGEETAIPTDKEQLYFNDWQLMVFLAKRLEG